MTTAAHATAAFLRQPTTANREALDAVLSRMEADRQHANRAYLDGKCPRCGRERWRCLGLPQPPTTAGAAPQVRGDGNSNAPAQPGAAQQVVC